MSPAELWLLVLMGTLFLAILSGMPAFLAIAGAPLAVAFVASQSGAFDLRLLNVYPARVWGVMTNSLLMAVPLFVVMGVVLERAQLAERMLGVLGRILGGTPRGMALAVLVFSTLIAAATGIIGATVVMLVLVALGPLRRAGVPEAQACGLICAAGTLGQIIPPSVLLVLLGDQIGNTYMSAQQRAGNFAPETISVGDLFAGALVPGLVLVGLYAAYVLLVLRPVRGRPVPPKGPRPGAGEIAGVFLPPMLLILAVLGSILGGVATPTEAAGLGAVGALLLAGYGRSSAPALRALLAAAGLAAATLVALRMAGGPRLLTGTVPQALAVIAALTIAAGTLAAVWQLARARLLGGAMADTLRISGMVFAIIIAASLLALVFRGLGGDRVVMRLIADLPGGTMGAMALLLVVVFLLGFLLEAVEIIYIVVPLLGPAVLAGDISPVWFGVLLAMMLQTSFLTPPFGFALFYFRSAAPREIATGSIYRGVLPYVLLQLAAVGLILFWPALATWLPRQIFG